MKGQRITYLPEELAWIEARKDWDRKRLHSAFCFMFDRSDVSLTNLNALCKRKGWFTGRTGYFVKGERRADNPSRKGHAPAGCEKGWFKKGDAAPNVLPLWSERMTEDGYIEMKVPERNPRTGYATRFVHKHRWLWEQTNGPVPEGMALKCIDGDRTNTDPSNWEAIPRGVLSRLNGGRHKKRLAYDAAPPELKPTVMAIAKVQQAVHELRKGAKT